MDGQGELKRAERKLNMAPPCLTVTTAMEIASDTFFRIDSMKNGSKAAERYEPLGAWFGNDLDDADCF